MRMRPPSRTHHAVRRGRWEWTCGFYPGSYPGECTGDTSEAFYQARSEFEAAWAVFLSKRTEADFQEWRDQRDWTAEK
jgi:hypothetical protein